MKFRYYIINEDYSFTGTNDEGAAREAVQWAPVIDVQENISLGEVAEDDEPIGEYEPETGEGDEEEEDPGPAVDKSID